MKRIRVSKIEQMIDLLESVEPGQGNDSFRRQAIRYLEVYMDTLDDQGLKTLVVKEEKDDV